jgi:hypothetical protein
MIARQEREQLHHSFLNLRQWREKQNAIHWDPRQRSYNRTLLYNTNMGQALHSEI